MNETIEKFKKQLQRMSYYNAAEGNWSKEKTEREICRADLTRLANELRDNNINPEEIKNTVSCLVSDADFRDTREKNGL